MGTEKRTSCIACRIACANKVKFPVISGYVAYVMYKQEYELMVTDWLQLGSLA
jgi:hypothetical protein